MAKDDKKPVAEEEEPDDEESAGDEDEEEEDADDDAEEDDAEEDDAEEDDAEEDDAEEDDAEEDEEGEGEDEEGEDEDEDEEGEDEDHGAAAKPAPRPKQPPAPPIPKPPTPRPPMDPARAKRRVVHKRGSPTRNIILFVILVGGLAALFGIFGSGSGDSGPAPAVKWKEGQTVNVEITLVTTDSKNLACAMTGDLGGKICAFETQNKRNGASKNDPRTEENLLQPYTTTDRIQFMGSGLWMSPAMKEKLDKENWDRPSPRFSVSCKLTVEGRTKTAFVQWKPGEGWHDGNGWYVGTLKDCTIQ